MTMPTPTPLAPLSVPIPDRRPRRTADQWQRLIHEFEQSGLPAKQFCSERDLGYLTFCKWRNRFTATPMSCAPSPSSSPASFIELDTIELSSCASLSSSPPPHWHIVLKLGNGVELCLNQANVST